MTDNVLIVRNFSYQHHPIQRWLGRGRDQKFESMRQTVRDFPFSAHNCLCVLLHTCETNGVVHSNTSESAENALLSNPWVNLPWCDLFPWKRGVVWRTTCLLGLRSVRMWFFLLCNILRSSSLQQWLLLLFIMNSTSVCLFSGTKKGRPFFVSLSKNPTTNTPSTTGPSPKRPAKTPSLVPKRGDLKFLQEIDFGVSPGPVVSDVTETPPYNRWWSFLEEIGEILTWWMTSLFYTKEDTTPRWVDKKRVNVRNEGESWKECRQVDGNSNPQVRCEYRTTWGMEIIGY